MEQRIGASSKPSEAQPLKAEPVTGAGFDPAFIPGITVPAQGEPEEPADAVPGGDGTPARPQDAAAPEGSALSGESADSAQATDADEAADGDGPDDGPHGGPVFEASDRRAKIVADRKGVRLRLDEEACEFRWDEIAAVETESPRFGKRFTITVHTPDRRWYPIEIEAASRSRFKEWDDQLDAVLDAYFEDEPAKDEPAEDKAAGGDASGDDSA
ncbi:hypothetical protein [Streptomyces sp. NBC_00557]|uniref:hypothetical protein n=1 Tax=Streptomyces sp. NBC_00557 TaxID=2975776 RepID=UPI002E8023F1|nr:hypothetical protein [Streptomyces sp. NBC_00557]WUC35020.1 hypothetical protein OG956_12735 [Streptomyces sp. NBC_00557]